MKCSCGFAFGTRSKSKSGCNRCGSGSLAKVSAFDSPMELAEAVASANAPKEIQKELMSRKKVTKPQLDSSDVVAPTSMMRRALKSATSEDGLITMASLGKELDVLGLHDASVEYLIGMAEADGILVREGNESWSWLQ